MSLNYRESLLMSGNWRLVELDEGMGLFEDLVTRGYGEEVSALRSPFIEHKVSGAAINFDLIPRANQPTKLAVAARSSTNHEAVKSTFDRNVKSMSGALAQRILQSAHAVGYRAGELSDLSRWWMQNKPPTRDSRENLRRFKNGATQLMVAKNSGHSDSAVSAVINGNFNVLRSPAIAEVLDAADELGYYPDLVATLRQRLEIHQKIAAIDALIVSLCRVTRLPSSSARRFLNGDVSPASATDAAKMAEKLRTLGWPESSVEELERAAAQIPLTKDEILRRSLGHVSLASIARRVGTSRQMAMMWFNGRAGSQDLVRQMLLAAGELGVPQETLDLVRATHAERFHLQTHPLVNNGLADVDAGSASMGMEIGLPTGDGSVIQP